MPSVLDVGGEAKRLLPRLVQSDAGARLYLLLCGDRLGVLSETHLEIRDLANLLLLDVVKLLLQRLVAELSFGPGELEARPEFVALFAKTSDQDDLARGVGVGSGGGGSRGRRRSVVGGA